MIQWVIKKYLSHEGSSWYVRKVGSTVKSFSYTEELKNALLFASAKEAGETIRDRNLWAFMPNNPLSFKNDILVTIPVTVVEAPPVVPAYTIIGEAAV